MPNMLKDVSTILNIMIIDNKLRNIEIIKSSIKNSNLSFKIIKHVDSATNALKILDSIKCNIIIFDASRTDINSYIFLKEINEKYPDLKMIMYTSINDFDNAENLLSEGLIDYIYKPLSEKKIIRSLIHAENLFKEIEKQKQEQKNIKIQYDENMMIFQDRFLINLVHGHLKKEQEILESFDYFNISIKTGYTVFVLKIDHYKKYALVLEEHDKQYMIFLALYATEKILDVNNNIAFINRYDEVTVIIGGSLTIDEVIKLADNIRETIKKQTNFTVTIGIGDKVDKAKNIDVSYKQCKAALRHNFYLGNNSVIHINFIENNNKISYEYPLKKEELLVYETVNGNVNVALTLIDELYSTLKDKKLPKDFLQKITLDIIVSINRYASELNIPFESFYSKEISIKELREQKSFEDSYNYLKSIVIKICAFIDELRIKSEQNIVSKLIAYIDTNPFENISIKKYSAIVNTTPYYLKKIFSKYHDITIYDYVVKIREKKSKEN